MGRDASKIIIESCVVVCVILFPFLLIGFLGQHADPTNGIRYGDRVEVVDGFFEGLTGTAFDVGTTDRVQVKFDSIYRYEYVDPRNLKLLKKEE